MKVFDAMTAELALAGVHPPSPWWRGQAAEFLDSGARTWVVRVGRGGAKSHFAVLFALRLTLFESWVVPAGERHFFSFVSIDRGEASLRLGLLEHCLRVLGVPFGRKGETIELGGKWDRLGLRVLTCSVAGTSGPRSIGFVADEASKWRSHDDAANPAREVIASLRATTVTHPRARELIVSSPWSTVDYHHELFTKGTGGGQLVSYAPTWVANPAVSEAMTHDLEPDLRVWSREYLAVPQDSVSAAFESSEIEAAIRRPCRGELGPAALVLDPSSLRGDPFAVGRVRWNFTEAGPAELVLEDLATFEPESTLKADEIGAILLDHCREHGIRHVFSDQRESFTWRRLFELEGLKFHELVWSSKTKSLAVERLRGLLRDRQLVIAASADRKQRPRWVERIRKELATFEVRVMPSGSLSFEARQGHHDDAVAVLLTSALADLGQLLPAGAGRSFGSTVTARVLGGPTRHRDD